MFCYECKDGKYFMARLSVSDEKIHKAKSIRFGTAGCRLRQIYSRKISQLVSWSVFLIKKKTISDTVE